MAKRFFSTNIWDEDWFLDMPIEYRLFWFYILSGCDHAGIFKINLRSFCGLNGVKIDSETALSLLNKDKQRIRVINDSTWFIEDFFYYQYGHTLNRNNRVHESIEEIYNRHEIKLDSIRGLKDLKDRVKDKDKDKDIKKGGKGENNRGVKFSEDKTEVVFSDGSTQKLGDGQILDLKRDNLSAWSIIKGSSPY